MNELTLVLWATDIESLVRFLTVVGGAEVETRHPGFARLSLGEAPIEIHADEAHRGHPWFDALKREGAARGIGTELRIRCDDIAGTWQTALREGATGIIPPAHSGETEECVVMGPDGYLFSFWRPSGS